MSISKLAFHRLEIIFFKHTKEEPSPEIIFLFLSGVNFTIVSDI